MDALMMLRLKGLGNPAANIVDTVGHKIIQIYERLLLKPRRLYLSNKVSLKNIFVIKFLGSV